MANSTVADKNGARKSRSKRNGFDFTRIKRVTRVSAGESLHCSTNRLAHGVSEWVSGEESACSMNRGPSALKQ